MGCDLNIVAGLLLIIATEWSYRMLLNDLHLHLVNICSKSPHQPVAIDKLKRAPWSSADEIELIKLNWWVYCWGIHWILQWTSVIEGAPNTPSDSLILSQYYWHTLWYNVWFTIWHTGRLTSWYTRRYTRWYTAWHTAWYTTPYTLPLIHYPWYTYPWNYENRWWSPFLLSLKSELRASGKDHDDSGMLKEYSCQSPPDLAVSYTWTRFISDRRALES